MGQDFAVGPAQVETLLAQILFSQRIKQGVESDAHDLKLLVDGFFYGLRVFRHRISSAVAVISDMD
jgi:hypothetical protein